MVTDRSAALLTVVVAVALLFPGVGSVVVELTVAVLVIVEPLGVAALTLTTSEKVAVAPAARVAMFAVIVPVPPTAGEVIEEPGPEVCITETKVVFAGVESVRETLCAGLGPLFVNVNV